MKQQRPVNLDLTTLKFPAMAIASILHRISGLALFILLPLMLYILQVSLKSNESFEAARSLLTTPLIKVLVLGFLAAFTYHLIAGIRHLIMDMGFGETVRPARISAIFVITLSILLTIVLGMWIW